jgi:hypothetical protein
MHGNSISSGTEPELATALPAAAGPADDRRQKGRVALVLRAAKLIAGSHEYLCILRDVSASGMKIRFFHPVPMTDGMFVETGQGNRYPVEMVWNVKDHAGFRFPEKVNVGQLIEDTSGLYPKRQLRLHLALKARLVAGGEVHHMTIHNLSQQGARIECEKPLRNSELVKIETDGLPSIFAKVRWRNAPQYGLAFEQIFRLDELAVLVAQQQDGKA